MIAIDVKLLVSIAVIMVNTGCDRELRGCLLPLVITVGAFYGVVKFIRWK